MTAKEDELILGSDSKRIENSRKRESSTQCSCGKAGKLSEFYFVNIALTQHHALPMRNCCKRIHGA